MGVAPFCGWRPELVFRTTCSLCSFADLRGAPVAPPSGVGTRGDPCRAGRKTRRSDGSRQRALPSALCADGRVSPQLSSRLFRMQNSALARATLSRRRPRWSACRSASRNESPLRRESGVSGGRNAPLSAARGRFRAGPPTSVRVGESAPGPGSPGGEKSNQR